MERMGLREILGRTWFFEGWEEAQLDALLRLAQERVYPTGKEIISEGELAEAFYILLKGGVYIKMTARGQGELVLNTLRQAGEIFGWSALIEGGRSTASAESLEESQVLSFRKKDLEALFYKDPALGYRFMKRLASLISRRLENTRTLLLREIS